MEKRPLGTIIKRPRIFTIRGLFYALIHTESE